MQEIYDEMNETNRLRKEVEEAQRQMLRERHRCRRSDNYYDFGDFPAGSATSGRRASGREMVAAKTTTSHPTVPSTKRCSDEAATTSSLVNSTAAVVSVRSSTPAAVNPEVLRPGSYLLCTWDCQVLEGNHPQRLIYQLGAFLPHGVEFLQCVLPEGVSDEELRDHPKLFRKINGTWCVKHHSKLRWLPTVSLKAAIEEFLTFLEKGCRSSRPYFDGVLLLSHVEEIIPIIFRAVKVCQLLERFSKTVKGMGDLCTYLAQCHMKRISIALTAASMQKLDLSLHTVYWLVIGLRLNLSCSSEAKAQACYKVLETLLETKPTYNNFFSRFVLPPGSRPMQRMLKFRNVRERLALFSPLKHFVASQLDSEQGELIVDGMYAVTEEDAATYHSSYPYQVAQTVCRILVAAGFDFDQMLKLYVKEGREQLELIVRTTFLGKMAGEPRAVVDQTIKTARSIVTYFSQNGHRPLKELLEEAKIEDKRMLLEEKKFEDEKETLLPERKEHTVLPVEPQAVSSSSQASSKLDHNSMSGEQLRLRRDASGSDHSREDAQHMDYQEFLPAISFYTRRLQRSYSVPATLAQSTANDLVNVMIRANLSYGRLMSAYKKDKLEHRKHRKYFRFFLHQELGRLYVEYGPQDRLQLNQFVEMILDFCGGELQRQEDPKVKPGARVKVTKKESLEKAGR